VTHIDPSDSAERRPVDFGRIICPSIRFFVILLLLESSVPLSQVLKNCLGHQR
jgi:hypothetical protein